MLRAWTPELAFHDEFKPILSLSVSPSGRFATAGADHNIRLWRLDDDDRDSSGCPRVVFLSTISKHSLPVNVVRFSPDGKLLASASDDCNVMLWTQDEKQAEDSAENTSETEQPSSECHAEPLPLAAPTAEPVVELDDEVICLTPASPTRSPSRPSDVSASSSSFSSSPSTSPPPTTASQPASPPSSPTSTPFASDPDADFSSLNIEQWSRASLLRGHLSEVYALHWSPDGSQLVTGSIEGRVLVWQLAIGKGAGKKIQRQELSDHNGYVQGVGWDPRGELVVSASSDRTVRVYRWGKRKGKDGLECKLIHTLKGRRVQQDEKVEEQLDDDVVMVNAPTGPSTAETTAPLSTDPASSSTPPIGSEAATDASASAAASAAPSSSASTSTFAPLFVDETLPSFFRRPAWSPDGLFVLLPAGCYVDQGKTNYCTWLYHRDDFSEPLACLTHTEPSVAAVFSPHPYRTSSVAEVDTTSSTCSLPVAYLFMIATTKSLLLYCTHSCHALASLTNLHLSALTDLAWAAQHCTQAEENDKQQPEAMQVDAVSENKRRQWATEDRVLVSSSDGYISIIEMQGLAEKVDGDERKQWEEQLAEDVRIARKRIEEGEDSSVKHKKRKKKAKKTADSTTTAAAGDQSAEGQAALSGAKDGVETSDEAKEVKSVTVFELTDELKAQLQQMVDAGVQVSVDSVREHCKVSCSRATRMARKWKELQRQQRKQQAEAAAKAAAERWEKMDKKLKERAAQQAADNAANGKEEKVEGAVEGRKDGEEASGEKETEKKRKERVKAPKVPVEDAKKMKKIDSFFTKSATPQYAVATSSVQASGSSSVSSSSSSSATGSNASSAGSCLPLIPLPLLPEAASAPGAKRKIVPVLISTLTPIDHNNLDATASAPASSAQSSASTAATKEAAKGKKKKKPASKRKAGKKVAAAAATPIQVSQQPTTAPALFAPSQPAAVSAPSTTAVSIDLTDEHSVSSPPASTQHTAASSTVSGAVSDTATVPVIAAATVLVAETPSSSDVVPSGAVIVRQGSGSRRVMAGPPPSADDQPPAKKPKRTIVPTFIEPQQSAQVQELQIDGKEEGSTLAALASSVAVGQTVEIMNVANEAQSMAVEVS